MSTEQKYWEALTQIHELMAQSDYFDQLHPAQTSDAVVNTFARFVKLAQLDRDEVKRLSDEKRNDAGSAALLKKIAGNLQAFGNLSATPTGLLEIEMAWGDFYEDAFNRRKAHAELADLLTDVMGDLERLGFASERTTPDIATRRKAWSAFYSHIAKLISEMRMLKQDNVLGMAERSRLEEKNRELVQQVAYEMRSKAEYASAAETTRDIIKMVIEVTADKLAEVVRRNKA